MDAANDNWIKIEGEDSEGMDNVQLHSPARDHAHDQPVRLAVDQAQTTLPKGVSALTKSKRNNSAGDNVLNIDLKCEEITLY